jgi:hypothetical protein
LPTDPLDSDLRAHRRPRDWEAQGSGSRTDPHRRIRVVVVRTSSSVHLPTFMGLAIGRSATSKTLGIHDPQFFRQVGITPVPSRVPPIHRRPWTTLRAHAEAPVRNLDFRQPSASPIRSQLTWDSLSDRMERGGNGVEGDLGDHGIGNAPYCTMGSCTCFPRENIGYPGRTGRAYVSARSIATLRNHLKSSAEVAETHSRGGTRTRDPGIMRNGISPCPALSGCRISWDAPPRSALRCAS